MGPALRLTAGAGATFTLVVLAVSVWLRVNTSLDAAGNAVSALSAGSEHALRIVHRLSASAVGLLALAAAVLVFRGRPNPAGRLAALALVIAMTLALAAVGRATPGYRLAWVTVVNVAGGIALASGFWWLRLTAPGTHPGARTRGAFPPLGFALVALAIAFAHSALGAAASAGAMHRAATLEPWHVGLGFVVAATCSVMAARASHVALGIAAVAQLATGLWLAAIGEAASPVTAWSHAAIAAMIVLVLVRLAVRR